MHASYYLNANTHNNLQRRLHLTYTIKYFLYNFMYMVRHLYNYSIHSTLKYNKRWAISRCNNIHNFSQEVLFKRINIGLVAVMRVNYFNGDNCYLGRNSWGWLSWLVRFQWGMEMIWESFGLRVFYQSDRLWSLFVYSSCHRKT